MMIKHFPRILIDDDDNIKMMMMIMAKIMIEMRSKRKVASRIGMTCGQYFVPLDLGTQ